MIRFIEVINKTDFNPRMERTAHPRFTLGEVWINEEYVVSLQEAAGYKHLLAEGQLPADLNGEHSFTLVTVNNGSLTESHVVVGSPQSVAQRMRPHSTQLLKG
jgi:hypothetical protein